MTSHFPTRRRALVVALCLGLLVLALGALTASAANTIVTPSSPDGWAAANVAGSGTVGITADNPRDGLGSLKFTSPSNSGKADFQKTWAVPTRTLGTLSGVSFEYYRDATSTAPVHLSPALRLLFFHDNAPAGPGAEDHVGFLVWEGTYNGINPAPTNSWEAEDLFTQNFWMRYVSGPNNDGVCNRNIENFNVTLANWLTGNPQGQPGNCVAPDLDANTVIYGINTGVGSGWAGTFLGYVDNVVVAFGADEVSANFEPNPICTTVCYADVVNGNDANGGTSPADAKKTIQAAVNQVTPAGQVYVLDGLYPESVNVNKAVTITGNGPANTTVDPVAGNGFNITASNVTIEDLKVQGAPTHGVVMNTPVANTTFDNVHFVSNTFRGIDIGVAGVTNVSVLNSLFDANGTGFRMASAATVDGILIENTTFQNNTGSGFNQANDGNAGWVKNLTVRDSTFTNNGSTSGHAGVYAEEFSNVLIEDSTFTGNQYGINLWDVYNVAASVTTNVIVRNNTFTDHKWSTIALQSRTSDPNAQLFLVENNTINQNVGALVGAAQAHLAVTTSSANPNGAVDVVDNTLTFSGTFPTGILATYGVYLSGGLQDARVEGNEIDGGNVGTNGATIPSSGIRLITNIFQTSADITITKNLINNFVNGVTIHDANNAPGGVHANSTVTITRNDLSGNSAYGIQSGPATESDGTCNWWGAADGPGGQGSGSGTNVSTHIDFTPWLYTDNLDGPCYIGGTITVVKSAAGGGTTQFEFDPSWSPDNFFLTDGGYAVSNPPLQPGNYSVSEVLPLPTGWSLDSAGCVNELSADVPVTPIPPSQIPVEDGDNWVCTFTNVYTPPPTSTCPAEYASNQWTDVLGIGMGSLAKHKVMAKVVVPNWLQTVDLYAQLVAKNMGAANYVRFMYPGTNNYVQVNAITSAPDPAHTAGTYWYGADLDPAAHIRGRWFLQPSGIKKHIPRALVLYPTYASPTNTYVNVWDTYDATEAEVDWNTSLNWTNKREIVVPIAAPLGETDFHVELALVDNDQDKRPVWVTVTAGGVSQTQKPLGPNKAPLLNLLVFDLKDVPAGTDEIVIEVYSPSMALDGVVGDSAALVGMAANYKCEPLNTD